MFVMYNTELTSNTAKPIKIHIPLGSGTVNGFFDLKEHKTDEKYAELLKKSTHKYFCIRGEKIMFYFHRNKLLEYVPNNILSAIHLPAKKGARQLLPGALCQFFFSPSSNLSIL